MQRLKNLFLNDRFIFSLILLNTICVFIEGFHSFPAKVIFAAIGIDYAITVLFIVELLIKVKTFSWKGYTAHGWNRFDMVLVLFSMGSLALPFTHWTTQDLSFLIVLRVARVFKFFRFLRFVPGIEQLVQGVQRALKTSVVVLIGFFVFIVVCALISNNLFKEISPEYFGDPAQSMYTIFRVFTIEGWYEIPDALIQNQQGAIVFFIRFYFVVLLTTGGLFGFSIVNSVFVDAMVADNNDALEKKVDDLMRELRSLRQIIEKQNR
ncbi:MAG TPA: ion transporter [Turneriella sp.]|nr:ion transporter [Turneriella sp.]